MGDTFEIEYEGKTYTVETQADAHAGFPWNEEDGHGPVNRLRRVSCVSDNYRLDEAHVYDMAGAIELAKRDKWGWLPGRLTIKTNDEGKKPYEKRGGSVTCTRGTGPTAMRLTFRDSEDVNTALAEMHAHFRATLGTNKIAENAAQADFTRMKAFCEGAWGYVTVIVREKGACKCCGWCGSLGGVESDAGGYIKEIAMEIIAERE